MARWSGCPARRSVSRRRARPTRCSATSLHDLQTATIRDGLHILGCSPEGEQRAQLLAAMTRLASDAEAPALRRRLDALLDRTTEELGALVAALEGCFVPAGPSGAPT